LVTRPALADEKPVPIAIVDTLNTLSGGPHSGYRADHAKGVLVTAISHPLSKAPHFADSTAVLVRFSDGTGVPNLPDANPNASQHGMAIRFDLPDGGGTDIVAISANGFPVATPEGFLALLQAVGKSGPDVPHPNPIEPFLGGLGVLAEEKWPGVLHGPDQINGAWLVSPHRPPIQHRRQARYRTPRLTDRFPDEAADRPRRS